MFVNSNTTPDELERMLFVVNPACHALFGENAIAIAELEEERDELAEKLADAEALVDQDLAAKCKEAVRAERKAYRRAEAHKTALRALINAILTTKRVPNTLRDTAKQALRGKPC